MKLLVLKQTLIDQQQHVDNEQGQQNLMPISSFPWEQGCFFLLNSSITGLNLEMIEVINKRLQYFYTATCLHSARCQQLFTFSSVSTTAYIQLGVNNCLHSAQCQQLLTFSQVSTTVYIQLSVNNCLHSARCQELFTFSSVSTTVYIQLGVNNCLH